jgi:Alpha/beta hydrolase family
VELAEQYAPRWLDEVPVAGVFSQLAPLTSAVARAHEEAASRPNELKMLLELSDGSVLRFRCEVEATPPHRIVFQLVSPAMAPSKYVDRRVKRDGRDVNIRDFGGEGPLLLLWHGSGCDVTVWEAVVPHLRSFRVIAQDLPGHGGSALTRLSASDTIADADALLASLDLGKPVVVGHSVGGWLALRLQRHVLVGHWSAWTGPPRWITTRWTSTRTTRASCQIHRMCQQSWPSFDVPR